MAFAINRVGSLLLLTFYLNMFVGLDIGGANLKAAHTSGVARLRPFELWKHHASLAETLRDFLQTLPPFDHLAVTMTGELCDCFETKRQGVNAILDAVGEAADGIPVRVWQTDGTFAEVAAARAAPLKTAAANWLALATFAGRYVPAGTGLLLDLGSTTADVIPLVEGRAVPRGLTDPERLRHGELVYTGVRRTPVCALLGDAVAAEFFATTLDAYLLLRTLPEDPHDLATADGRPATRPAAHARLARMVCGDAETCDERETLRLAQQVRDRQRAMLQSAVERAAARLGRMPETLVFAGSGEFLLRELAATTPPLQGARVIALAERLGPDVSTAACAYAVAVLASEKMGTPANLPGR